MRPQPIFDTNIFGHVQDGTIPAIDWRFLLKKRPGHGWALSSVTVLELLAGLPDVSPDKFIRAKERIELASKLSLGRAPLEDPRFLLCTEVLRAPFPSSLERVSPEVLADHFHVVRCAHSPDDIRNGRVRVKRLLTRGDGHEGFAGFDASVIAELVAGPKRDWIQRLEEFATYVWPPWREHFKATDRRLPEEIRATIEPRSEWYLERRQFPETFLEWLEINPTPELLATVAGRLDAVFEFTMFVDREFLLRNYNPEKHESDVYDQFQLYHLALDRFVIVTEDSDLVARTVRSSQATRIQSLEKFLQSL